MRKHRRNQEQTTDVDMTPMLDIVFIMLIFFIVTTSFVKESGVNINRPSKGPTSADGTTLVVEINEVNEVSFSGRAILADSVQANTEIALSKNPNTSIIVKIAKSASTGVLIEVVDQIKLAGVAQVTVAQHKT
jgi:biopolymer transport protein ExbD